MNLFRIFSVGLILSNFMLASSSMALTPEQKEELFTYGTITVRDIYGQPAECYQVKFMSGAQELINGSKELLNDALDNITALVDRRGFWEATVLPKFKNGLTLVKQSMTHGVGSIPEDYNNTLNNNKKVEGNFGETAKKAANWITFGARILGRFAISIGGAIAGPAYSVIVPSLYITSKPIIATCDLLFATAGTGVVFTWNGIAWILVRNRQEPKSNDFTVRSIPIPSRARS